MKSAETRRLSGSRGATRRLSGFRHTRVVIQAGLVEQNPVLVVVEPKRLGVAATCRASFYVYSIPDEVDRLVAGLVKAKQAFA